jgi:nickel/cobalt transporter (NicO) family protein
MIHLVLRNNLWRRLIVIFIVLSIAFGLPTIAWAHPLGNFTINHYAGLHVSRDSIAIDFVLDMAEIPAFQEITSFDTNGNGRADPAEAGAYHAAKCKSLQPDLRLLLNNKAFDFSLQSSSVDFPAGAGGLPTLRLTCEFSAPIVNAAQLTSLSFADQSYAERIGWREIVVNTEGVTLNGEFSSTSISNRLTSYPKDLLSNPLDQRQITLGIGPLSKSEPGNSEVTTQPIPSLAGSRSDRFTQLITLQNPTPPMILFALLVSLLWGAMHALTPGHGKTIVGAYLVGSRGTPKHALYLGLTTTITHTLGVFALGLVTLFAARFIVPEKLYPWMSFLSGLLVVGMGANLLVTRLKSSGIRNPLQNLKAKVEGTSHVYLHVQPVAEHIHTDANTHRHNYLLHPSNAQLHLHDHSHPHDHYHPHDHHHDLSHNHDGHSHLPPGSDGSPVTWRSLLLLGISGGIIPCPSALVVLLGAIALNRIGFGLILVLAFSLGLAGALTAIGLMFIYAGRLFEKVPMQGKVVRVLPVLSALFVALIGLAITIRALQEIGLLGKIL